MINRTQYIDQEVTDRIDFLISKNVLTKTDKDDFVTFEDFKILLQVKSVPSKTGKVRYDNCVVDTLGCIIEEPLKYRPVHSGSGGSRFIVHIDELPSLILPSTTTIPFNFFGLDLNANFVRTSLPGSGNTRISHGSDGHSLESPGRKQNVEALVPILSSAVIHQHLSGVSWFSLILCT